MDLNNQRGSAIISVIVFITIILFFISGLLLYKKYQTRQISRFGDESQAYYNARSALTFALKDIKPFLARKDYTSKSFFYSLFGKDSTTVQCEPWGYYLRCISTSKIHDVSKTRTFFIGAQHNELSGYAMIVGNTKNPVVVTGNTLITGDVAVGLQGVKPGVIKGKRYKSNTTVFGTIHKDINSYLPKIKFDFLFYQKKQLKNLFSKGRGIIINPKKNKLYLDNGIFIINNNALKQLKKQGIKDIIGPGFLLCNSDISLDNMNFYNQILMYSTKAILFSGLVQSDALLVFADDIGISSQNELQGQFYADNKFSISNGAKLKYPSIAGIISKKIWNQENIFFIGPKVEIDGSVILANDLADEIGKHNHKLQIHQTAKVKGFTYSDNFTEIQGSIYGTVMTNKFHFYLSPTNYMNWVKDAEINRHSLTRELYYPLAFEQESKLIVVREL